MGGDSILFSLIRRTAGGERRTWLVVVMNLIEK